jgi:hypothetical protein
MDRRASDTGVGLEALVGAAGYSATRCRLMHLLLQCAIETLQYAQAQLEHEWPLFCAKQGALLSGAKGRSTGASGPHPSENAITNELGTYVDRYLQSLPANHPYRGVVVFRYERPLPSAKLAGSKQKRQDFHYSIQFPDSPQFVIEAKPLFEPRDLADRYLGEKGIGRFTRQVEPYTDGELAAMLGYVQKGHAHRWRTRIRDAVAAHEGCDLVLDVRLSPDEHQPATYSSRHARTHPRLAVWVLHLLLEYPPPLVS